MEELKKKAFLLGASKFGASNRKDKRFYVIYGDKKINFGQFGGHTFIDHHDIKKRDAWRKRHSKIISKDGIPFYMIKTSPEFWSWNLLW